jgi:hypothetical protein
MQVFLKLPLPQKLYIIGITLLILVPNIVLEFGPSNADVPQKSHACTR